jgi:hypothetical protein
MNCLTPEQLAQLALGLADDASLSPHLDQCDACRRALAETNRVVDQLSSAHADLNRRHAASRAALLAQLSRVECPTPTVARWKRVAFGGLGLAAAAVLLFAAFFATSSSQLSAMERMVNAVREVTSFSYKLAYWKESPATAQKPGRTLDCASFTYWRAPQDSKRDDFGDLRASQKNEAVYHSPTSDQKPVVLTDLVEINPSGKRGILIDYLRKTYFQTIPLHANDISGSTPLLWLRAVREKAGKIVGELGTRQINDREARGYTMIFDDAAPFDDFGPVEVWIDSQTDLPVEFSFRYAKAEEEGFVDKYSVTDIQWNAELEPKLFDTTPPAGFLDITLPNDERSIAEAVTALNRYAQLSGGRYPHVDTLDDRSYVTKFDAAACYREMLELAGFTGPQRDEWVSDPSYQQIQQSRAGLDTLERVLHNPKWRIGYNGSTVRAQDKDKVLLWWAAGTEPAEGEQDQYRLFYGDLRTEVVPREKWVQFVPPEIAQLTE